MEKIDFLFDENLIKKKLLDFDSPKRISIKDELFMPSAVLFAIIPYKDKPYDLIVIHRTDRGENHRGEMSFPGGKFDAKSDKTLKDTALRETEEEIGVPRDKIKILGCLHDFPTMSRYIITTFVGIIDKDQKLIKDEREVQEIVKIPIDFFVSKKNFSEQALEIEGKKIPVFYFNYRDPKINKTFTVWGATAHIIVTFIKMVYNNDLSKLGIRRFSVDDLRKFERYIKYKNKITNPIK